MPELGVETVESGDVVECGKRYFISNVEEVTTEVSFYQGIRVEMVAEDGAIGTVMLWKRAKVGTGSKLGVFMALLGSNTDKWLHQGVMFQKWEKNARIMVKVNPPTNADVQSHAAEIVTKKSKKGAK